jgi:hypothetical protein
MFQFKKQPEHIRSLEHYAIHDGQQIPRGFLFRWAVAIVEDWDFAKIVNMNIDKDKWNSFFPEIVSYLPKLVHGNFKINECIVSDADEQVFGRNQ